MTFCILLSTREGCMPTMTKSRLIAAGEIPFKHAWARFPSLEIDRDSAIIDLAYLIAGLVTIAQSRLVQSILQGVEHTDPREWSNSHCSIEVMAVQQTASLFNCCSLFSFQRYFILLKCTESIIKGSQLHIYVTCCFANSSIIYRLYFNIINTI